MISYWPSKQNQKADALTCQTRDCSLDAKDNRQKEISQTILTPKRLYPDIVCEITLVLPVEPVAVAATATLIEQIWAV